MVDPRTRQALTQWTLAQPAVSAFVHAWVQDRTERDDVLQEVAVAVLESYETYDPSRPFLPWALGIARHLAADSLRRRRRRPLLLGQEAAEALAGAVAEVADAERDRLSHLSRCIQELDGRAREICELRYRQDLAPSAIASMLGIQPNTAAKALQRVREQLRQCIERRVRAEAGL
jgi:RNA polymerase sigma-70 factor (ECF subfamily)